MVDSIRSGSTHRTSAPSRSNGRGSEDNQDQSGSVRTEERSRIDSDRNGASGTERLHGGGEMGAEPWGQDGRGAYSNGCVASMFATEWKNQRPDEFRAAAADLRDGKEVEVNGQVLKLDDQRRETLASKGLLESDEAVIEATLLGAARKATGQNAEGGTDADGVKFLEDTLQLGVNLAEGGDAKVGDYVAVGSGDNKHFMKVTGSGSDGYKLTDAFGNQATMSASELKSQGNYDSGDNFGTLTNANVAGASRAARPASRRS